MIESLNFLNIMDADSKIDWDYYCFSLMISYAFCKMLSHCFCNKGRVPCQIMVSLILSRIILSLSIPANIPVLVSWFRDSSKDLP